MSVKVNEFAEVGLKLHQNTGEVGLAPNKKPYIYTEKERQFITLLLATSNKSKTYQTVYGTKDINVAASLANRLLKKEKITCLLNAERAINALNMQKKVDITRETVLIGLMDIVNKCSAVEAVRMKGKVIVKYQPNAAVRAWELIGKEVAGMFTDKAEIRVIGSVEQREQRLAELRTKIQQAEHTDTSTIQ